MRPKPSNKKAYAAYQRRALLKHRYGITPRQYATMLRKQGYGCAICGAKPKKRRLAVDHDHQTNVVRGLLCFRCNRHLIRNHRSPFLFERAAEYLRKFYKPTSAPETATPQGSGEPSSRA